MSEILLVEDDYDLRQNVGEFLTDEGFEIRSVSNGREALSYLGSGAQPCVILLDLMMPVMDGWQFRAEQLKRDELSRLPVILLSGDHNLPQKAQDLSVEGFLAKPFDLDELLSAVRQYCAGRGDNQSPKLS